MIILKNGTDKYINYYSSAIKGTYGAIMTVVTYMQALKKSPRNKEVKVIKKVSQRTHTMEISPRFSGILLQAWPKDQQEGKQWPTAQISLLQLYLHVMDQNF